jgi:hypothetical protein
MSMFWKIPGASEVLARALTSGDVSAERLVECVFYAAEDSTMEVMREVARLEDGDRARVLAFARELAGDPLALRLLLQPRAAEPTARPALESSDAP